MKLSTLSPTVLYLFLRKSIFQYLFLPPDALYMLRGDGDTARERIGDRDPYGIPGA
jgi:hypothetical protein